MSKYKELWIYIKNNAPKELTFDEVEKICSFPIDHSFLSYKKELTEYGYQIEKISLKEKTILINKIEKNNEKETN